MIVIYSYSEKSKFEIWKQLLTNFYKQITRYVAQVHGSNLKFIIHKLLKYLI